MPDEAHRVSHPWRRCLRFSVRGLIVFVLLFGLWLGFTVRNASIQRDAAAAIVHAGGSVAYSWEDEFTSGNHGAPFFVPSVLVDRIGVDFFGAITSVAFDSSATAADAEFKQVLRLTDLDSLRLTGPS